MSRQLFYQREEIIAEDFNQLRNSTEKSVFESFLGKALPKIPAFISRGFKVSINGNNVNIEPGIGFQRIAQTDGSTSVRPIVLEATHEISINLPSVGVTRTDLIECQSNIVNDPPESRRFKSGPVVVDRQTIISNKWSNSIRIRENVSADSQGNYTPSIGWVVLAIVESTSTGIQSITDLRTAFNVFDPDFFSTYGKKNISFTKVYDGINLIQVPFQFSELVSKLSQISVRRLTKERYSPQAITAQKYNTDFPLTAPSASSRRIVKQNFLSFNSRDVILSTQEAVESLVLTNFGRIPVYRYISGVSNNSWLDNPGSPYEANYSGVLFNLAHTYALNNNMVRLAIGNLNEFSVKHSQPFSPNQDLYILLWNSNAPLSLQNAFIYKINRENVIENSQAGETTGSHLRLSDDNDFVPGLIPIYKSSLSVVYNINRARVSTVNPLVGAEANPRYEHKTEINISSFYTIDEIIYNPDIKQLKFNLIDKTVGSSVFPNAGRVFDRIRIKKGTEVRLTLNFTDLTVSLNGTTATYTYNLTSQDTLIKMSDTDFANFNIEFDVLSTLGEQIWRANLMRGGLTLSPTVDFVLVEEGSKTYVRLNSQYPFRDDDQLIFSHIVTDDLIRTGSESTPGESTIEDQVEALMNSLNSLTTKVNQNEADIDALETPTPTQKTFYGLLRLTPKNASNKTISQALASLSPLVNANALLPSARTEKTFKNLSFSGGLFRFNAPAIDGYFNPWIVINSADYTNLVFKTEQEETSLWRQGADVTIDSVVYHVWIRTRPILRSRQLRVFVEDYE